MPRILSGPIHLFQQPSRRDPEERLRDRLSIANSAVGIGAGVAAIGGAALLARKGVGAIGRLEQQGSKVLSGLKDTAKSTIEAKVHPAVDQIKHAAANAQQAAQNTANATVAYADMGKVYRAAKGGLYNLLHPIRTAREIKNAYRAGRYGAPMVRAQRPAWAMAAKAKVLEFANPSVAQDRYRKGIKEADADRALHSYRNAALVGGVGGLLLRKAGISRLKGAGIGAAAGIGAQSLVRAGTGTTKDGFGDRSTTGKKIDALAPAAGALAVGLLSRKKLGAAKRLAGMKASGAARKAVAAAPRTGWELFKASLFHSRARAIHFSAGSGRMGAIVRTLRKPQVKGKLIAGAALAGGIATADAVTGAVYPEKGRTAVQSAQHGLSKGALYGTALAASEPLISAGLRRILTTVRATKRPVALSARGRLVLFGGSAQLRDKNNRFVDPVDVASGTSEAWYKDDRGVSRQLDLPVQHAQVLKAAWNKGRQVQQHVQRGTNLVTDAVQAARGVQKTDSRGRPVKREWEKAWVRNAAGSALLAGGVLGHAAIMRRNPVYRAKVANLVKTGKTHVNKIIPDFFPGHFTTGTMNGREIRFDVTAPDWDVRDQRGRSARVFAPGARPRDRREKNWHERVNNIRLLGLLGTGAGAAAGVGIGALLWRKRAPKITATPGTNIVHFPKAG